MSDIIYHYCSWGTFKKIIAGKSLRFSDIMKSNDSKEILYLWDKYYQYIDGNAENKSAVATLKYEIANQLDNMIFLALCFSRESDSLHMWNCYADGGVAIGFDEEKIQKWADKIRYYNCISREIPNGSVMSQKKDIDYFDEKGIEQYIANKCKDIEFVYDKFDVIFFDAPFCKSDFFEAENEVRIILRIYMSQDYSNLIDYGDDNDQTIKLGSYENKHFNNVIYADIPFPKDIISRIVVGPNCSLSEIDIKQLLFVNGFSACSIDVEKSKGSYR